MNRIDCVAHGLCSELLPDWIRLDERGYPILNDPSIPLELVEHARRATTLCPALALWLEPENVDPSVATGVIGAISALGGR